MPPPPLRDQLRDWIDPGLMLSIAIYHYVATLWTAILSLRLAEIKQVRARAFTSFWKFISPPAEANAGPQPMIGAFQTLPDLLASAKGHVLEIGSGTGILWKCFDTSKITHLYATEPVLELHSALHSSAESLGLDSKLTTLACGGQPSSLLPALSKFGIWQAGSFDTIISLRSLCTVPDLESSVRAHYKLLKPGGRYIICEHVVNPWRTKNGSVFARGFQLLWAMLGWTYFVGGCKLSRDTIHVLNKAGEWEKVEIRRDMDWAVLPFVTGVYTKI